MIRIRRTLIILVATGLWGAAQKAWGQAKPSKRGVFKADFEAKDLAQWTVKVADKRNAGTVKIETVEDGKAFKLTGPALEKLEGKPNVTRVQIEEIGGDSALRVRGPVFKIQENKMGRTNTFREDTIYRHSILSVLPMPPTDTFDLEVEIRGVGGIQFGG